MHFFKNSCGCCYIKEHQVFLESELFDKVATVKGNDWNTEMLINSFYARFIQMLEDMEADHREFDQRFGHLFNDEE